ncbi:MAG: hypothetical protein ACE5K8_10210 [Candidatus Zixiibacteriota bacterium]
MKNPSNDIARSEATWRSRWHSTTEIASLTLATIKVWEALALNLKRLIKIMEQPIPSLGG